MVVWHVAISGFRQAEDRPNGMLRLWLDTLRPLQRGWVFARYAPWNHDWRGLARLIQHTSHGAAKVAIYGYSYGAGWGAIRLAEALGALGIGVEHAVLCDPIHRYAFWPANWRAVRWFAGRQKVTIPPNVRQVVSFIQRSDPLLWGHEVVAADPRATEIAKPIVIPGVRHDAMDDHPLFRDRAALVARSLARVMRVTR